MEPVAPDIGPVDVADAFATEIEQAAAFANIGRVLKAISDSGVDLYALAAVLCLGKRVSIRPSLEGAVHARIAARAGGSASFLSPALSIGWAHSDAVVEITRTRAGVGAVLLVDALSAGVSTFLAAQCLAELLRMYGCPEGHLPSVDVLERLVGYLSPFAHEFGFARAVQVVDDAVERVLTGMEYGSLVHSPLRRVGIARPVARAVKELLDACQRGQGLYMSVPMRGAWLCAFASHVLGMAVELRQKDTILWAQERDRGSVILNLSRATWDDKEVVLAKPGSVSDPAVAITDDYMDDDNRDDVASEYVLSEALGAIISRFPNASQSITEVVHRAICRYAMVYLRYLVSPRYFSGVDTPIHPMNGPFNREAALRDTLCAMGIPEETVLRTNLPEDGTDIIAWCMNHFSFCQPMPDRMINHNHMRFEVRATHGLLCIGPSDLAEVRDACDWHSAQGHATVLDYLTDVWEDRHPFSMSRCWCGDLGRLIRGFAVSAFALSASRFDAAQIRVQGDVLSDSQRRFRQETSLADILNTERREVTMLDIWLHLTSLLHGDHRVAAEQLSTHRQNLVGVSAGSQTIFFTCYLDKECYDDRGRFLSIRPGRASVNGVLRLLMVEHIPRIGVSIDRGEIIVPSRVARGANLEPSYLLSAIRPFLTVSLTECAITITPSMGLNLERRHRANTSLLRGIRELLRFRIPRCDHAADSLLQVRRQPVAVLGLEFMGMVARQLGQAGLMPLLALRGNKGEQIFACSQHGHFGEIGRGCILQGEACLECCVQLVESDGRESCVMMS